MLGKPGSTPSRKPMATDVPLARPGQVEALEREVRQLRVQIAEIETLRNRLDAAGIP